MKIFSKNPAKTLIFASLVVSTFFASTGPLSADALKKYAHQPQNSLAQEPSPYLRQHSRDLVKWHAWNAATLAKAKKTAKPIFLSVGYSACHWCHVMQEQSFNNQQVADLLNEHFIPVLVDREQRPDLDETYMLATEAINGVGGWPNNVFLTPQLKPFYGGVYYPPKNLTRLLTVIATEWATNRPAIKKEATRISKILASYFSRKTKSKDISRPIILAATKKILSSFDGFNGGMGTAPKHFNAPVLRFLVDQLERTSDDATRQALTTTLNAVTRGGVHDQLAGGFHRYAVDNAWRIPHFEKMLYDQAQLAEIFARTARLTGHRQFAATAKKTFDYVLGDLTSPQGGFYATRDADSEGEEGTYYVWTTAQMSKQLGTRDAEYLSGLLGVVSDGELAGKIIIHRDLALNNTDNKRLTRLFEKLLDSRKNRPAPHRDEKILAGWNGLMISAFAAGARHLGEHRYRQAALNAAEFVWTNMRTADGLLHRSYYNGNSGITANLPDYAFLANAYIDLYDLTGDKKWLQRSQSLIETMDKLFLDESNGDYFYTAAKQGYARIKLRADTALPSGNAIALEALVKLSQRTLKPEYARAAEALIAALSGEAIQDPVGGVTTLSAANLFKFGQTGPMQYAARGQLKLTSVISADGTKVQFKIKMAPGWHVNSNKPFEKDFIATRLTASQSGKTLPVLYPKSVSVKLGFQQNPLSLFEENFSLELKLSKPATKPIDTELELQACNDQMCLLPETLKIRVIPTIGKTAPETN
jgi:uncharacterized protein YyaL (SSP411 family)